LFQLLAAFEIIGGFINSENQVNFLFQNLLQLNFWDLEHSEFWQRGGYFSNALGVRKSLFEKGKSKQLLSLSLVQNSNHALDAFLIHA